MKQEQLKKSSFLSHLEQLRWHLVYSFLAIILFTIISFINIKVIFDKFIFAFLNTYSIADLAYIYVDISKYAINMRYAKNTFQKKVF